MGYRSFLKQRINWSLLRRMQAIYFGARGLFYSGKKVFCTACGRHYAAFLPLPGYPGKLEACPGCNSLARHRLLWLYLTEKLDILSRPAKVLHMSPEYIFFEKFSSMGHVTYASADLNSIYSMVRTDITRLPFPDDAFDLILCVHVLEHIPEDREAMAELRRVLSPGGVALLQVPIGPSDKTFEDKTITSPEQREIHFGSPHHVRLYGKDYKERLEAAGFRVRVDDYAATLLPQKTKTCGIDRDEALYVCTKPA